MDFLNAIILLLNYIFVPALTYGSQLALRRNICNSNLWNFKICKFCNRRHDGFWNNDYNIVYLVFPNSIGISLGVLPTALLAIPFAIVLTIGYMLLIDKFVFRYYRDQ